MLSSIMRDSESNNLHGAVGGQTRELRQRRKWSGYDAYRQELAARDDAWQKEVESYEPREPVSISALEADLFTGGLQRLRNEIVEQYERLNNQSASASDIVHEIVRRYERLNSLSQKQDGLAELGEVGLAEVAHQATIEIAEEILKGHEHRARHEPKTKRGAASLAFLQQEVSAIVSNSPYKFASRDASRLRQWSLKSASRDRSRPDSPPRMRNDYAFGGTADFMIRLQRRERDAIAPDGDCDPTVRVAKIIMERNLVLACTEPHTWRGKGSAVMLAKFVRRIEAQSRWKLVWREETEKTHPPLGENGGFMFTWDRIHKDKDLEVAGGPAQQLVIRALRHYEEKLVALIGSAREKAELSELDPEEKLALKHRAIFEPKPISAVQEKAVLDEMILPWIAEIDKDEMRAKYPAFFEMISRRQSKAPYIYMMASLELNGLMLASFTPDIRSALRTIVSRKHRAIGEWNKQSL
jgi:hypothetical protein